MTKQMISYRFGKQVRLLALAALFLCTLGAKGLRFRSLFRTLCAMALLATALLLPMAIQAQEPVVLTTDANNNGVIDDDEKNLYLIQTNQFPSLYWVPKTLSGVLRITTNNIPDEDMLWYFLAAETENAGTGNEIQYYYIVSNSEDKYICHGGGTGNDNTRKVELVEKNASNEERCKFKLVENNPSGQTGFYNIDVKGSPTYYALNKESGNLDETKPIRLTNNQYVNNINSRWKFIPFNGTYTWPAPPFTVSTDSEKHYYKIQNKQSSTFYVSTDATPEFVTYSNVESNQMVWYFEDAGSDTWFQYYYIINPQAGDKYMYYSGTATDGSNQDNAVKVKAYDSENEDRYQFVVVQAVRIRGSSGDTPEVCYAIMPKLLLEQKWLSNSIGSSSISNGATMGIIKSRSTNNTNTAQWLFVPTDYPLQCAAPAITYSSATGKITITSTTPGCTIYYTTDGTTPSSSNGTQYSAPFGVSAPITIKAIATKSGFNDSEVTTKSFDQVATPSIQDDGSNAISITCATAGATIYYTTDGSTPTTSSTVYTNPLTENVSGVTIKAIAVKEGMINSVVASGSVILRCAKPIITKVGNNVTISCSFPSSGVSIYYTQNGGTPSSSSSLYSVSIPVVIGDVIRAIAIATGYNDSEIAVKTIHDELVPIDGIYYINNNGDFETFVDMANEDDGATYHYELKANVVASAAITKPFSGVFDGGSYSITGLTHPLFNTVNGGVVKNVTLKNVAVSSSDDNVGAIAGVAQGYSRIYNCGILPNDATFSEGNHPTVTGGTYAGGIVGKLDGDSRVINCYSYADVSASTYAAGIVGYNTYASTAEVSGGKYTKLKTAVVNCMFYGNITGGTNQYGVYGGLVINNATSTGISSYNYFRNGSTFTAANGHPNIIGTTDYVVGNPTDYNCSFPADERYLTQVEFHRSLLNSNRELCGWWVGSDVAPSTLTTAQVQAIPKDASLMYKWVVDPNLAPYPILKPFGKYPSVVNGNTGTPWFDRTTANPYQGKQLGTLTVTVKSGDQFSANDQTRYLPITDMDTLHYDFGYYKVQLPYYNTVFGNPNGTTWEEKYAGNYTDYVVTGWKVTAVTTDGSVTDYNSFVANWESGYNFADRHCTDKDLYATSGRVFAQGGNYYVPDGVTAITIEAYWGKAIYVRNNGGYYDRVNITLGNTGSAFAPAGVRGNNVNDATIQTTSIRGTLTNSNIDAKKTVYDYALVLVGNVQESVSNSDILHATEPTRGFTIMSVDLDFDEEPDYCLEWQLGKAMVRQVISPVRFDFLPVVELGIAGKLHNSTNFYSLGCYRSEGHFEVTETSFIRFGQFEFELKERDEGPVILNGGIYDQYCRGRNNETNQHINYVILGGHVVMPSFTPGAHVNSNATYQTRHCAVNALGGDFKSFYLTGGFNESIVPYEDNPHCYIDGGRFGTIAAAYKEGIWGDVTWRINHALIGEFYGGGVMSQATGTTYKIVKGSIDVVVDNSIVRKYCGGPKFGDMVEGKTVTTSATGTTFGVFYGAGNGGTNYVQYTSTDDSQHGPQTQSQWAATVDGKYHPGKYRNRDQGYEANYDIEVINWSTGDDPGKVVNRSYYYSAQFATTNTGDVTSTLTNCTVKNNFYGAGFLGGVTGSVTSTLDNTRVMGSVYGAGYSAASGTVTIQNKDKIPPVVNMYTGMITYNPRGTSTPYTWTDDSGTTDHPVTGDSDELFYTEVPLDNLGAVQGNVTLTIKGQSVVGTEGDTTTGNVFGGGEQSAVMQSLDGSGNPVANTGNTTVILQGGTKVLGNVYGGGNEGEVGGNSQVTIQN